MPSVTWVTYLSIKKDQLQKTGNPVFLQDLQVELQRKQNIKVLLKGAECLAFTEYEGHILSLKE